MAHLLAASASRRVLEKFHLKREAFEWVLAWAAIVKELHRVMESIMRRIIAISPYSAIS
jgi:hypothetical protein